jgi:hypothetical protein
MSDVRIAVVALVLTFLPALGVRADGLPVFGYLEKVRVGPTDLLMRAKPVRTPRRWATAGLSSLTGRGPSGSAYRSPISKANP